jgi:hypothetical protein
MGKIAHDPGRVSVRPDPELVRPLYFKHVGEVIEDFGNVGVVNRHSPSTARRFR